MLTGMFAFLWWLMGGLMAVSLLRPAHPLWAIIPALVLASGQILAFAVMWMQSRAIRLADTVSFCLLAVSLGVWLLVPTGLSFQTLGAGDLLKKATLSFGGGLFSLVLFCASLLIGAFVAEREFERRHHRRW